MYPQEQLPSSESLSIIGPRSYHTEPYPQFLNELHNMYISSSKPGYVQVPRNSHIHLQHHVEDAYGHTAKHLLKIEVTILESMAALRATDMKGTGKDVCGLLE